MIDPNILIEKLRPFTVGLTYKIGDEWSEDSDAETIVTNAAGKEIELQIGEDYVCINEHDDESMTTHGTFELTIDGLDWMGIASKLRELLL